MGSRDVNRHGEFRHKPWHGMAWRYRPAPLQGGKNFLRHAPPCHRIYKNPPCGGFPPQHFQTAMAVFRHSIFKSPWRISATAFSDRHGGFPPQHFQIAMADFRHSIFKSPGQISATPFLDRHSTSILIFKINFKNSEFDEKFRQKTPKFFSKIFPEFFPKFSRNFPEIFSEIFYRYFFRNFTNFSFQGIVLVISLP